MAAENDEIYWKLEQSTGNTLCSLRQYGKGKPRYSLTLGPEFFLWPLLLRVHQGGKGKRVAANEPDPLSSFTTSTSKTFDVDLKRKRSGADPFAVA